MPMAHLKNLGCSDRNEAFWHASASTIEDVGVSGGSGLRVRVQSGGALRWVSRRRRIIISIYLHATVHLDVADGSARFVIIPDD